MVRWTSGLPVTSMMRSKHGSEISARRSVTTGISRRRASSKPGAQGLTSPTPRMVTVGSPANISRRARPPLPAPTMATLVMRGSARRSEGLRHPVGLGPILEGRVLRDEGELHHAGGAIALLADDHVGHAFVLFPLQAIAVGPVQEEDEIGVLLEGARLAQIGELRLLTLPALHGARELGEGDHGHVELLGQRLEGAGNLRDLLLAVLRAATPHELEVVDHDHVEAVLRLPAPRLRPCLEHGERGGVVDEDGRLGEPACRVGQARPVARVEIAGAHLVGVDPALRAQEALHELLLGHLEAQHEHPLVIAHAGVLGDVHGKGRLPHGGPARDDDEIARLEARGQLIELAEAGGESGDVLLLIVELLDLLEGALEDGAHGERRALHAPLGDLEDEPLRVVQHLLDVVAPFVALADDLGGDADEVPQHGLLADDAPVREKGGGSRGLFHERAQRRGPAHFLELVPASELLGDSQEVNRLVALEERQHGVEDLAVAFLVEVGRLEELDGAREAFPIEEHPAEHRPLGLQAVRWDLGGEQVGEGRHGYSRVTETLNWAVTSAWSRTGTVNSPMVLMGSSSPMRRRSISIPCWARKAARSALPTEPKSRPSSDAWRAWVK